MNELLFILKKEKVLTDYSVRTIEHYMEKWDTGSYYSVLECNLITENEMADLLSRKMKIDRIYHLTPQMIEEDSLEKLPFSKAVMYDAIPLRYLGKEKEMLEIVMANPTDSAALQGLRDITGCEIVPVVTELKSIRSLVHEIYPLNSQIPSLN
ncbi:hypothetical protein N9W79_01100 [bacterium]|nr:hypothetical protein [bacterium]